MLAEKQRDKNSSGCTVGHRSAEPTDSSREKNRCCPLVAEAAIRK